MKKIGITLILVIISVVKNFAQVTNNGITAAEREKYIQKAAQLRQIENYADAVKQLDSILIKNPKDAGVLLFKGDLLLQGKKYSVAVVTYKQLLALEYEPTISKINLSYALFMNHQPVKALQYAHLAWEQDKSNVNAIVNYFNALLWNIKTDEAAQFLKQQQSLLTPAQLLVLKARLYTTSGDYNNGLKYYDSLVSTYPDKYYVQEYAEVLLGKKEIKRSVSVVKNNDSLFSTNENHVFQQKIMAAQQQNAGTEFIYFRDVARNIRLENNIWWQQREGRTYRFRLSAGASVITSAQDEKTTTQFANIAINERWNRAWSGETVIHLQLIQPSNSEDFIGITGKQLIKFQPNDRRMFGIYIGSDILNFTASLLEKNIRSNYLGYETHLLLTGKTGFYSQGNVGILSDNNKRYQVFGSLYHLLRTEPTIKGGINFSALHFSDNTIKTYFSPDRYLSSEAFVDYSTALPHLSKFYLQMQAAAGMQQIERLKLEPTVRLQSELGLRLNHFETALKYQFSNVASAAGTGYRFNTLSLRLLWKW